MIGLITWNVQSARTAAGTPDWQRVVAALWRFHDADILCLQEVSSGFPAPDAIPRVLDAVLAGDFNMLPGAPERQRLLAPFDDGTPAWHDAWQLARPGQAHAPTVGIRGPDPYTFDYAFVGARLAPRVRGVRVDAAAGGSEHQPLLLEMD